MKLRVQTSGSGNVCECEWKCVLTSDCGTIVSNVYHTFLVNVPKSCRDGMILFGCSAARHPSGIVYCLKNGCPSSGVVSQVRKKSKSRYKYKVSSLKRRGDHILSKKISSAPIERRNHDLWQEVKRFKGKVQ